MRRILERRIRSRGKRLKGRHKRQNMESEAGVVLGAEVQKQMRRGTNFCMKDWLQGQREQVDKES